MTTIKIKGMSCQHCAASVQKALEALPGLSQIQVNVEKGEASFTGQADADILKKAIDGIGFTFQGVTT